MAAARQRAHRRAAGHAAAPAQPHGRHHGARLPRLSRSARALPSVADVLSGTGGANTPAVESFAAPGTRRRSTRVAAPPIVQQLVCDVTGRAFADVVRDLVLRPFGMVDSALRAAARRRPSRPRRHRSRRRPGDPVPGGHHVYPELQAAGLWTTVVDLARWVIGVQQCSARRPHGPDLARDGAARWSRRSRAGRVRARPRDRRRGRRCAGSATAARNEGFRSQVDGLVERPVGGCRAHQRRRWHHADAARSVASLAAEYGWGDHRCAADRAGRRRPGGAALVRRALRRAVRPPDEARVRRRRAVQPRPVRPPADAAARAPPRSSTRRPARRWRCTPTAARVDAHRRARRRQRADGVRRPSTRPMEERVMTTLRRPRVGRRAAGADGLHRHPGAFADVRSGVGDHRAHRPRGRAAARLGERAGDPGHDRRAGRAARAHARAARRDPGHTRRARRPHGR